MSSRNIARLVQIAMAIEPIPDKKGLTTRSIDIVDNLKLEYFIIGAINSGPVIEELMNREEAEDSYDLLLKCTIQNHLNRGGLRVNAGQLQFLWPILLVIRNFPSYKDVDLILDSTRRIMLDTSIEDGIWLQNTSNFSYSLWEGHSGRSVLIDLTLNVYGVYEVWAKESTTSSMHCKELIDKFPTLRWLYKKFSMEQPYSFSMKNLYNEAVLKYPNMPKGQIADLLACVIFLSMYCDDYQIT
jgi:hypothetical protein